MPIALPFIVFIALCVETITGFGATVLAVALAAHLLPLKQLLPILIPTNLVLSSYLVFRYRKSIHGRLLITRILPLMACGMVVGLSLFHLGDDRLLQLSFAAFVVVLASWELLLMSRRKAAAGRPLKKGPATAFLLSSGVIHGMYASGGPMLVYFVGREPLDKSTFRATLSAVWWLFGIVLLVDYLLNDLVTPTTLGYSAWLLLPLVGGIVAGEGIHRRLNVSTFRTLVFVLLLGAGIFQLYRAW